MSNVMFHENVKLRITEIGVGFSIAYCLLGTFVRASVEWIKELQLKSKLQKQNLQTELALIKARINPHFLFNTLNNIDILIEKDAKTASVYLKKLSDIMRFMLYETTTEQILLLKELEYIEKYIELQKIRTSNQHFVNLQITGNQDGQMIAPMIFIPFIENAFKYTTNKKIEKAINIEVQINEADVFFTCTNIFDDTILVNQKESGLGIELMRQRLKLLYNDKHELEICKNDKIFTVKLKVNTK
jgi:LytS/YehU family sensor histidine kinase